MSQKIQYLTWFAIGAALFSTAVLLPIGKELPSAIAVGLLTQTMIFRLAFGCRRDRVDESVGRIISIAFLAMIGTGFFGVMSGLPQVELTFLGGIAASGISATLALYAAARLEPVQL